MDGYAKKIQQAARLYRSVTTAFPPANIDDEDILRSGTGPRLIGQGLELLNWWAVAILVSV